MVPRNSHLSEICDPISKSLRPLLGVEKFRFGGFLCIIRAKNRSWISKQGSRPKRAALVNTSLQSAVHRPRSALTASSTYNSYLIAGWLTKILQMSALSISAARCRGVAELRPKALMSHLPCWIRV